MGGITREEGSTVYMGRRFFKGRDSRVVCCCMEGTKGEKVLERKEYQVRRFFKGKTRGEGGKLLNGWDLHGERFFKVRNVFIIMMYIITTITIAIKDKKTKYKNNESEYE